MLTMPGSMDAKTIAELNLRINYLEEAIENQAREYARRLDELNHAHQQERERQADYVRQDNYDTRSADIDKQLRVLNTFMDRILGRVAIYHVLAFVASGILGVVLHFWH